MPVASGPCSRLTVRQAGFTLIEGIISIVILGIAMITLTSFLFPQAERSATPYYQARASAIGNAFLNEVLSRKFDEYSDPFGDSAVRCGEAGAQPCTIPENSGSWPRDDVQQDGTSKEYFAYVDPISGDRLGWGLMVSAADDVDDFHGCWGDFSLCGKRYSSNQFPWRGFIENLLADDQGKNERYLNMTVKIAVSYDTSLNTSYPNNAFPHQHKRIDVEVDTGRYGTYDFVAYRSNY
ncbi:type IV pilus modification PilV family protein [Photobacterium kasasachensis]|uniref:type IV pilus modification PilV family protein n=1 Tax=Photobacterium kasasachensis TaxID=2910240 RepID=UPI003D129F74